MTGQTDGVRPGLRPVPGVVGLTGDRGPLARALLPRLVARGARAVHLDDPSTLPPGCSRVVHLGWSGDRAEPPGLRSPRVLAETRALLDGVAAGTPEMLLVVTSTAVHGARADNAVPLPEDAPLRADPDPSTALADLLAVEALAVAGARRGAVGGRRGGRPAAGTVVVVRPASLLGAPVGGVLAEQLAGPRLVVLRGSAPLWQVCHVDDLASALVFLLGRPAGSLPAVLSVASAGLLDQEALERASGRGRVELSAAVAQATAARLRRARLVQVADELPYLTFPWVVDPAALRAAGWEPSRSAAEAVQDHQAVAQGLADESHRHAGATVAGATVALVGSAALVRRVRGRRGR